MSSFKKFVLVEAPATSSLKEGKDYNTLVDSPEVRVIQFETWKAADQMIPKTNRWHSTSNEPSFKEQKKEEPCIVVFFTNGDYYLIRFKSGLMIKSDGNRIEVHQVQDLVDDHPELTKLSTQARNSKQALFFPFIKSPVDQDILDYDAGSNWNTFWQAVFQYVRDVDGDLGKELQAKLITDTGNIQKVFGTVGQASKSFRNGIIGKLVKWDKDVITTSIAKLSKYSYSDAFVSRMSKELTSEDYVDLVKKLVKIDSYDVWQKIQESLKFVSDAGIISTDKDLELVLAQVPEDKIAKVIEQDTLISTFNKLSDKLKDVLVKAHYKFVIKNKDKFPSKWVERARWKDKSRFDIKY